MTLKDIIWFESCDSTMDICHRFASVTEKELSIGAFSQLKGRGTKNRSWVSPKGNVFLSFFCKKCSCVLKFLIMIKYIIIKMIIIIISSI